MNREDVYKLIDGERDYQNQLNLKQVDVGCELALLHKYLHDANVAFAETFDCPREQPTMNIFRKIAAICIRAMETNGAPKRNAAASLASRQRG